MWPLGSQSVIPMAIAGMVLLSVFAMGPAPEVYGTESNLGTANGVDIR